MALGMLAATFMDIRNSVAYRPFYVDELRGRCRCRALSAQVPGNCDRCNATTHPLPARRRRS